MPHTISTMYRTNIARISALHLAFVRLVGRGGELAPRRGDLPALWALVEEVGASLGQADVRARDLDVPDGRLAALGKLEPEDGHLARLLLLLFHLRRGLLA